MAAPKKPRGRSFEATLARMRERHPNASKPELIELAKDSYRPNSEQSRQRVLSKLDPFNRRGKRQPKKGPRIVVAGKQRRLSTLGIVEFCQALGVTPHPAQAAALKAMYGEDLNVLELELLKDIRPEGSPPYEPGKEFHEVCFCVGRRGGKSLMVAVALLYECIVRGWYWRRFLGKDEPGYCLALAQRELSAQQLCVSQCARLLSAAPPAIRDLAESIEKTRIKFRNRLIIQAQPLDVRASRGLAAFVVVCEESAHWSSDPAAVINDQAVLDSVMPMLSQWGDEGGKVIHASTPCARQGAFYDIVNNPEQLDRIVFHATSKQFNPDLSDKVLRREQRRNPESFEREFNAVFAERLESYFSSDLIDACCTLPGDVPYDRRERYYLGADQSGGGEDHFGVCVAHRCSRTNKVICDVLRSYQTGDLDAIVKEITKLVQTYRIRDACIDAYAYGWVSTALKRQAGLRVRKRCELATAYAHLKMLMTGGGIALSAAPVLREGLLETKAFWSRNNRLSVQHPRGGRAGHGDASDAAASAAWLVSEAKSRGDYAADNHHRVPRNPDGSWDAIALADAPFAKYVRTVEPSLSMYGLLGAPPKEDCERVKHLRYEYYKVKQEAMRLRQSQST